MDNNQNAGPTVVEQGNGQENILMEEEHVTSHTVEATEYVYCDEAAEINVEDRGQVQSELPLQRNENGDYYVVVNGQQQLVDFCNNDGFEVLEYDESTNVFRVVEDGQDDPQSANQQVSYDSVEADVKDPNHMGRQTGSKNLRGNNAADFTYYEQYDGNYQDQYGVDEDQHYVSPPPDSRRIRPVAHIQHQQDMDDSIFRFRPLRQPGNCVCSECGASFINMPRLERHMAVHQVFGSFLCPLCGKTYKYEYNLFYHWRKTCKDLNELVNPEERKNMDVHSLRELVDEVAQKKADLGPIDVGVSNSVLFCAGPLTKLEMPSNGRCEPCSACGVAVPSQLTARHLSLHSSHSNKEIDGRVSTGGFFCDLCGLSFRHHFNLLKHWRTSCPEIQANLPVHDEITMTDEQLKQMIRSLMISSVVMRGPRLHKSELNELGVDEEELEDLSKDEAGVQRKEDPIDPEYDDQGAVNISSKAVRGVQSEAVVYADDFMDEDGISKPMNLPNKSKFMLGRGDAVRCPECFRCFANMGRLERHLAGFHSSYGPHHCVLCGNRFKYDYNLLYHYRRSCAYTKAYIDRDIREQMDASSLRKLVKQVAQKAARALPNSTRVQSMRIMEANAARAIAEHHNLIQRREVRQPKPPPELMRPRAGTSNGQPCPYCGIIFYGESALDRHVRAAHGIDMSEPVPPMRETIQLRPVGPSNNMDRSVGGTQAGSSSLVNEKPREAVEEEEIESPPVLTPEEPGGEEVPLTVEWRFETSDGQEIPAGYMDENQVINVGDTLVIDAPAGEGVEYTVLSVEVTVVKGREVRTVTAAPDLSNTTVYEEAASSYVDDGRITYASSLETPQDQKSVSGMEHHKSRMIL